VLARKNGGSFVYSFGCRQSPKGVLEMPPESVTPQPLPFRSLSAERQQSMQSAKRELSRTFLRPSSAATFTVHSARSPQPRLNVVGVGLGEKVTDGKPTGVPAIKILVRKKFSDHEVADADRLPSSFQSFDTDVEEVGTLRRQEAAPNLPDPKVKFRPAQPGCSIGFQDPQNRFTMAGTFGALVQRDGELFVLSNNHVLADEDNLPIGSATFQPGLLDGGDPTLDQIAALAEFVPLDPNGHNAVDAAISKVLDESGISNDILIIGPPSGTTKAVLNMSVHKFGRTSSYTTGRVTSVETDVKVEYSMGTLVFTRQILISGLNGMPFSEAGDSGSLILEQESQKAVGLLFAGSDVVTIANPIDAVLSALRIELA
jgi:hypothetical protein